MRASNFINRLAKKAQDHPDTTAVIYLDRREREVASLSYAELDQAARQVAAGMLAKNLQAGPVLLVFPTGPEFLVSLLGTFYAGITAAAMPVPKLGESLHRTARVCLAGKFHAILSPADVSFVSVPTSIAGEGADTLPPIHRYDELVAGDPPPARDWPGLHLPLEAPLFLQYTSGSTQDPRGIVLNNRCLLANLDRLAARFQATADSCFINWMPHHHDMGLIGNLLLPLNLGARSVQLAPLTFMQCPLRWLRAFSRYQGNIGGAPPFAYELCVETVTPAQVAALDLSHWHAAICGAEPVYRATISRFRNHFKAAGFPSRTLFAAYGLAESTLFVAGGNPPADDDDPTTSAGSALSAARAPCYLNAEMRRNLQIVDPQTCLPRPDCEVGEVWLCGDSVAAGYDQDDSEPNSSTFNAKIAGSGEPSFLRTGDLGFVEGDRLYLTGRIKDTLIVNGANFSATDVEWAATRLHRDLNQSAAAAFHTREDQTGPVVLLIESRRKLPDPLARENWVFQIRAKVAEDLGIPLADILILPRGTLPKTTSGKVQRRIARSLYQRGAFTASPSASIL